MSKKQLIKQVLIWIDRMAHQDICNDNLIKENCSFEWYLRSAESALLYKDKIIEKYQKLLHFSVEDQS